jgi:hypothetical protein
MRIHFAASLLTFCAFGGLAAEEPTPRLADAERAAEQYMTAFFHSDLRTAASLTHPETLQQIKSAFTQAWEEAKASGKEAEFLGKSGIEPSTDLRALDLIDFYVTVVGGSRRSAADATTAMKATAVAVSGSELAEAERVAVTLAITTPAGGASRTQESKLLLARVNGQWKVLGNAR